MDNVKVALGNKGMTVKAARQCAKDRKTESSFTRPYLLGPVLFRTGLPCSGGYHLEREGMPLHDVVVINC